MIPKIIKGESILNEAANYEFVNLLKTPSMNVAAQKINGEHRFKHRNNAGSEFIVILSGAFSIWTESGVFQGAAGDIICIPQGLEHGNIKGDDAKILILEN